MIKIKIFDTHCDTAYVLHKKGLKLDNDQTHITKNQIDKFDVYEQMFAIWSTPKMSGKESWEHYQKVKTYYTEEILSYKSESFIPHLSIENSSLLDNDVTRVDMLKDDGVRMMGLVWKDDNCIGGAHNTNNGFTSFGKDALRRICENGMIPDISHASDKMSYETFEIASEYGIPVCASHSNSRKIREHTRNMTDDMFNCVKRSNGLVGLNFCCEFLEYTDTKTAYISSLIKHLEHFLSLGGEDTMCLGCDLDGISTLPIGLTGVESHYKFYEELRKVNYSDSLIEKIFYTNAHNFFEQHK